MEGQREAFATALAGLYKLAGVDLTREQIAAPLAPASPSYCITPCGLKVRPAADGQCEAIYPLRDEAVLRPGAAGGAQTAGLPVRERDRLLFRETPIRWAEWAEAWQRDQMGQVAPTVAAAQRVVS